MRSVARDLQQHRFQAWIIFDRYDRVLLCQGPLGVDPVLIGVHEHAVPIEHRRRFQFQSQAQRSRAAVTMRVPTL